MVSCVFVDGRDQVRCRKKERERKRGERGLYVKSSCEASSSGVQSNEKLSPGIA